MSRLLARTPWHQEIPSVLMLIGCYGCAALVTLHAQALGLGLSIMLLALTVVMHSSLQHEFIHGHPTRNQALNDFLVSLPLGLYIPYLRFRDTHLAHHHDPSLTDPYDDPESNYLDPTCWNRLPDWQKHILNANNTLLGRMGLGPLLGLLHFYRQDLVALWHGDRRIRAAYLHHAVGLVAIAVWQGSLSHMPTWAYMLAAWIGLSILKVRTFLEHQAHRDIAARSVIIEDRGLLALLFLNNNYHAVHHAHPGLVWHRIPMQYAKRRDSYLQRNRHYRYRSYWQVFRLYLLRRKDPVPHPLIPALTPRNHV